MQNKTYFFVVGSGYLPFKFATKELAEEHAKVSYYDEPFQVLEGEESFRCAYKKLWAGSPSNVKDIENDKKWNRLIRNLSVCTWHALDI